MKFYRIAMAAGLALWASAAPAQNVGINAGIWWIPVAGQPSPFTVLNPLTTLYGRVGILRAFQRSSDQAHSIFGGIPAVLAPGQSLRTPDAWGGILGIGVRLMPVLRYELQLGGTFNAHVSVDAPAFANYIRFRASSVQLMNNLYLDIAPFFDNGLWGLNPYLLGGVGVSWNTTGDQEYRNIFLVPYSFPGPGSGTTRASFAWNLGAGIQWQIAHNLIVDVSYRYLDAGRVRNGFSTDLAAPFTTTYAITSHQFMVGVVVPFDGLIRGFGD